jgi:hypothetical protein
MAQSTRSSGSDSDGRMSARDLTLEAKRTVEDLTGYSVESVSGSQLHGGAGDLRIRTRILRVDALARAPVVEEHVVPGNPSTLAVFGGRVFHDALDDMRAGERPAWKRTALQLPVRS